MSPNSMFNCKKYFRVQSQGNLLTPINATNYVTLGEKTLHPSHMHSLFSGLFPLSYKQEVCGWLPRRAAWVCAVALLSSPGAHSS